MNQFCSTEVRCSYARTQVELPYSNFYFSLRVIIDLFFIQPALFSPMIFQVRIYNKERQSFIGRSIIGAAFFKSQTSK